MIYGELHRIACKSSASQVDGHTLQPTGLVIELRFFGGHTVPEVAQILGTSDTTVERAWRLARAWLQREMGDLPAD